MKIQICSTGEVFIHFSPGCIREDGVSYEYNSVSSHVVENEEECAQLSVSLQKNRRNFKGSYGNDGTLFWTFGRQRYSGSRNCRIVTKRNKAKNEKLSSRGLVSGNQQCGKYFSSLKQMSSYIILCQLGCEGCVVDFGDGHFFITMGW